MHRVVALVGPVQSTYELGCLTEVFGTTRREIPQHYQLDVCAEKPGLVPTTAGYAMSVSLGLSALQSADTVVIPGWLPLDTPLSNGVRPVPIGKNFETRTSAVSRCMVADFACLWTTLLGERFLSEA